MTPSYARYDESVVSMVNFILLSSHEKPEIVLTSVSMPLTSMNRL